MAQTWFRFYVGETWLSPCSHLRCAHLICPDHQELREKTIRWIAPFCKGGGGGTLVESLMGSERSKGLQRAGGQVSNHFLARECVLLSFFIGLDRGVWRFLYFHNAGSACSHHPYSPPQVLASFPPSLPQYARFPVHQWRSLNRGLESDSLEASTCSGQGWGCFPKVW